MSTRRLAGIAALLIVAAPVAASEPFNLDPSWPFTSNPAVTVLADGGFLAVWTREVQVPLPFGPDAFVPESVAMLRLNRSGKTFGEPRVVLGQSIAGRPSLPQVAFFELGRALMIWQRVLDGAFLIEGRLLAGKALAPRAAISSCAEGDLSTLRLAPATGSGYWALWRERCGGRRILAERLSRNGLPIGPLVVVAGPARQPGFFADIASLWDGGFAAVWVEGASVAMARVFRPNGRPATPAFQVGPEPVADPPGSLPPATVAIAAARESILVAWRNRDSNLLIRAFDLKGSPLGPPIFPAPDSGGSQEMPRLACSPVGEAVLSWRRVAGPLSDSSCWVRRIDLDGRPRGAETLLAEGCLEAPIAVSEGGSLLAVWSASFQQGDNHFRRVQARQLDLSDLD
jgi:hypothetical protein